MQTPAVRLILVMGLPGSGKTYFAKALAMHLGVLHLNSDRIRKELVAEPTYSSADRSAVYVRMFDRCTETLEQGYTVIVDATFSKAAYRAPYLSWAAAHAMPVFLFFLQADEATTRVRVNRRRLDSDADYAVYQKIKAEYEPILQEHEILRSDQGSTAERIAQAVNYMAHDRSPRPMEMKELLVSARLPHGLLTEKVIETHISWVLLCAERVYKIKKPITLSFLDFSTLAKRKYYVEQELMLNQRLCPQVYLQMLPIFLHEGRYHIGGTTGQLVDYALEMKRLDNELEMDHLLAKGAVTRSDIDRVLKVLIPFHQLAEIIQGGTQVKELIADFVDIEQIREFCRSELGEAQAAALSESISFARRYLTAGASLIDVRDKEGFTRDVHGDLHAGNIFLTEEPVLFDCIEFNPRFRQIDLLNELAFFTMELEFADHPELSSYLIESYCRAFPMIRNEEEEALYLFYKLYRANVRMKVTAIGLQQPHEEDERSERLAIFKRYFELYMRYYKSLANALAG